MTQVIPAIIPTSLLHLEQTLTIIAPFTHDVQIDIVDGKFVPFTSWPYTEKASPKEMKKLIQNFIVEVDLMVQEAEEVIPAYAEAGVKRMVVHLESALNLPAIMKLKSKYAFELGFSIDNDTDVRALTSVIPMADYVQLMGIAKIGSQGQPFDNRVLSRIKELKDEYPATLISIDGSVNTETLPLLCEAGADRFIAGSSIVGVDDPHSAYVILVSLCS